MKKASYVFHLLCVLGIFVLSSCGFDGITAPAPTDTTVPMQESTSVTEEPYAPRFTVRFDENETFATEADQRAAERIDHAILRAVELLNTVNMELPHVLDCDYDTRATQRDTLKDPLSVEMYDRVQEKVSVFEPYHFSEKSYPDVDFFSVFVPAMDALRIDRTELFLYCDGMIRGLEYSSCYFMPGNWLDEPCDDMDAIRNEVALCNAVVERILKKMPDGMTNAEKCCYFAFVLSAGIQYDNSEDYPKYDYQAYGALVNGIAVCSGYAQAFYRLCREAGIACWYCRGTTPTDRHAWNMIETESGSVYIDVTWYDNDKLEHHYLEGKEQYLFMTQEDFEYYGYVQESCQ